MDQVDRDRFDVDSSADRIDVDPCASADSGSVHNA